jgi:hypothetical protein
MEIDFLCLRLDMAYSVGLGLGNGVDEPLHAFLQT